MQIRGQFINLARRYKYRTALNAHFPQNYLAMHGLMLYGRMTLLRVIKTSNVKYLMKFLAVLWVFLLSEAQIGECRFDNIESD